MKCNSMNSTWTPALVGILAAGVLFGSIGMSHADEACSDRDARMQGLQRQVAQLKTIVKDTEGHLPAAAHEDLMEAYHAGGIWALDSWHQAQCYVEGANAGPVSPQFCAQFPSPNNVLVGIWTLGANNQANCYAEGVGAGPVSPALCGQRPSPNNFLFGIWALDANKQAQCFTEGVGAGPVSPALCGQRPSPNNDLYGVWHFDWDRQMRCYAEGVGALSVDPELCSQRGHN